MTALTVMLLGIVVGVEKFLAGLPPGTPGFQAAAERLREVAERLRALGRSQDAGDVRSRQATTRLAELRREIRAFYLLPIAALATSAFRDDRSTTLAFRMPRRGYDAREAFLAKCRNIHAELVAHRDTFVTLGMDPDVPEQFAAALDEFEALPSEGTEARQVRRAARTDTERALDDLMDLIHRLDGLMRLRFRNDPATLAKWQQVRNIPWSTGAKVQPAAPPAEGAPSPAAQ
jgi:hypothetical protein